MQLPKIISIISLSAWLFLPSACAPTSQVDGRQFSPARPLNQLGILPFTGPQGKFYADLLTTDLLACGLAITTGHEIEKILAASGYQTDDQPDLAVLPQFLNKKLGLTHFLIGAVATAEAPAPRYDNVSIDLRLLDLESGEITWASRTEYWSRANNGPGDARRAIGLLARDFCQELTPP